MPFFRLVPITLPLCSLCILTASCGNSVESLNSDPDFLAESPQLCATGGVMLNDNAKRRLSEAKYLPNWAPIYPNSSIKHKAYFCNDDNRPIYAIAIYKSGTNLQDVIDFYDSYYSENRIEYLRQYGAKNFKTYVFGKHCRVNSKVSVRDEPVLNEPSYISVTIVMTFAGETCDK